MHFHDLRGTAVTRFYGAGIPERAIVESVREGMGGPTSPEAAVAECADCGILLDLHNLFANGVNGRQSVEEFIAQLPLERVWEIHVAGGVELDGYWLDAHSGGVGQFEHPFTCRLV